MVVEFDPEKNARNTAEQGLSFDLANELDWSRALIFEDERKHYGELRLLVFGHIGDQMHVAVVTPRHQDLRVISLRRANRKEAKLYEQETGRSGRVP